MTPKTIFLALLLAFAAAAAPHTFASDGQPAARENAAPAPAKASTYQADLYDILYGLPFYEGMAYAKLSAGDGYSRAMLDYYLRHVSKADLTRRLVPGLAAIVPPALAARVAASMREPAYRKRMQGFLAERTGSGAPVAPLTADELALLNRIDNEQPSKDFAALMPKVSDLVRTTLAASREEIEMKLAAQALATIETTQAEIAQVEKNGQPVEIRTIGFEPWDQIIRAVGVSTLRMAMAFYRFNQELDRIEYSELVQPSSVATRHNYDAAATLVDRAEDALSVTLKELDDAIREREEQIRKSEFAAQTKFRAKLDDVTAGLYTFAGDLGEAYRGMFSAQRQMVGFLKERHGNVKVEGKQIVFEDDANVATMNDILQRIVASANAVQSIVDRQTARETAELDKARGRLNKAGK